MRERKQRQRKPDVMLRILRMTRPIAKWIALGAVLDMLTIGCTVLAPKILGSLVQLLDDFRKSGFNGDIHTQIATGALWLLAAYGAGELLAYASMQLMNRVVSRFFTCEVRIRISEKLRHLPVKYMDQTPVGDVLNRMTEDVSVMGNSVHQILDTLVKGVFQILVIAVAMLLQNWGLALMVIAVTPLSILLSSRIASISEKHYDKMFEESGKLSEIVEESFSNYATTKAYNLEAYTAQKHEQVNRRLEKAAATAWFSGSVVEPLIALFNNLAYILICLAGGWMIVQGRANVGTVVTILLFSRQFASPLSMMANGFSQLYQVKAAAGRVFALLDMTQEEQADGQLPHAPMGRVELEHVDFSYTDQPLIEDLCLRVQPGQKVAIVGPTGAGKTTIVNLLMRFYEPKTGCIRLDGQDTAKLSREAVRNCFGMVLQDTWLFHGTIAENVAYGKPGATRRDVEKVCKKTYCDHFIRTMPDGYDTVVGDDVGNLSGGQKQLLTIARALLADRPLLILDEATSNVDTRTELLIQKAMDQLMDGRTCFVIAHRLSTIVDSDLILVLDHGRIVEEGTHRSLLQKRGFYYQLYSSQYAI